MAALPMTFWSPLVTKAALTGRTGPLSCGICHVCPELPTDARLDQDRESLEAEPTLFFFLSHS